MATSANWKRLLAEGRLQPQTASRTAISALRSVIERDLRDAAIPEVSADRRFATAYNAVLQTARLVIAASGHRLASDAGHHRTAFEAARDLLGSRADELLDYFDVCRRKRNQIDYFYSSVATETEAAELTAKAEAFLVLACQWVQRNHPALIDS